MRLHFKGKQNNYIRETENGQIHCIQILTGKWGNEFSVDIGVHLKKLPSFEAFCIRPRAVHPEPNTVLMMKRYRNAELEQLFAYGETPEEAEILIRNIITACLNELNEIDEQWKEGKDLLEVITPEVLEEDKKTFYNLRKVGYEEQQRLSETMKTRQVFEGWYPNLAAFSLALASLSKSNRKKTLMKKYVEVAESEIRSPKQIQLLEELKLKS